MGGIKGKELVKFSIFVYVSINLINMCLINIYILLINIFIRCGFHSAFTYNNKLYRFFVIGDQTTANTGIYTCSRLLSNSANGNFGADGAVSVYSHEVVETVTNYAGAWESPIDGQENADL